MRRLPHVNEIVDLIHEKTAEATAPEAQEKIASVDFVVPVAGELHKLANRLKDYDADAITYADVSDFANQLMGRT